MAVALQPTKKILDVPPIEDLTEEQLKEGEKRYLKQKQARAQGQKSNGSNDVSKIFTTLGCLMEEGLNNMEGVRIFLK